MVREIMWATDEAQGGEDPAQPTGETSRMFTQSELDQIVVERARRAKSSALNELLQEVGTETVDDLKALVQRAKERETAEQSELEKLTKALAEYQKKEQTWEEQRREQALQLAVQTAAQKLGVVDAEVILELVRKRIDFDRDGAPQGVEAALSEVLKAKPYLKAGAHAGSPTNPPRGGRALTREEIAKMTPAEINANWDAVRAALEKGV
ncbi:MAG: hypothetical protein GX601_06755 [Anaerolineales bacterium]|jgi:alanyl-tRNA synthetase|nr:hypothetical protein [Anaerolineales bacterium]